MATIRIAEPGKELRDLVRDCISPQAAAVILQAVRQRLEAGIGDIAANDQVRWFADQLVEALDGEDGYRLALRDVGTLPGLPRSGHGHLEKCD
jgi:hypothetical protein